MSTSLALEVARAVVDPARLAAVSSYRLAGHAGDPDLDAVVAHMARLLRAPIAVINLVGPDLQCYAAEHGVGASTASIPDALSFCAYVVAHQAPLTVPDAASHPVFAMNPLVAAGTVSAYLGVPLIDEDGFVLGALGVFDTRPRQFTAEDTEALQTLAALVRAVLSLRRRVLWQEWDARLLAVQGRVLEEVATGGTLPPILGMLDAAVAELSAGADPVCQQTLRDTVDRLTAIATEADTWRSTISRMAHHDPLTGLLNRAGLIQQVDSYLTSWPALSLTVLMIDLDRFKVVNDSLGHRTGDDLLTVYAQRLATLAGPTDPVARLGGDEFVVAMFGASVPEADRMAEAVLAAAREPVEVGASLLVTASVGLGTADAGGADAPVDWHVLLREADAAMYRAKESGRNQAVWFDEQMYLQSMRRMQTERDLRQALEHDELFLDYQPAFDLRCERIDHVEALVRWQHPTRGLVPPLDFIPVAEDCGLIHSLGEWVLARAVEQAASWAHIPDLRVWINVSPQQLAHSGFPDLLATHLNRVGLPGFHLGIEVTESTLADRDGLTAVLQEIRELGVAIAIDDFGTGYSSLGRLSTFPVDVIKIDRSFVADVETPRGEAILAGIVTLAHATGAHVIAEGVETQPQLAALSALGVDSASGYLLAKPTAPEHLPLPRANHSTFQQRAGLHPRLQRLLRELAIPRRRGS